jgi:hypothetical protein
MPGSPICTRLPDWLADELRQSFQTNGDGVSEGLRRIVEEWWVTQHMPEVEFRDGPAGRRAGLKKGPDIWQLMMIKAGLDDDLEMLKEYFGGLPDEQLRQALAYTELFPERVSWFIRENERVEQYLREKMGWE